MYLLNHIAVAIVFIDKLTLVLVVLCIFCQNAHAIARHAFRFAVETAVYILFAFCKVAVGIILVFIHGFAQQLAVRLEFEDRLTSLICLNEICQCYKAHAETMI